MNDYPEAQTWPQPSKSRVWIVEDHVIFRDLLSDFLGTEFGYEVVGKSESDADLIIACNQGQVDIVILDLRLRLSGGLIVLERLRNTACPPKIIIISATATEHSVQSTLSLGALSYIEKTSPLTELGHALKYLQEGKSYFSEGVRLIIANLFLLKSPLPRNYTANNRDNELLKFLAKETPIHEIANQFGLSKWSVYRQRAELVKKIGVKSELDLVEYAKSVGLGIG